MRVGVAFGLVLSAFLLQSGFALSAVDDSLYVYPYGLESDGFAGLVFSPCGAEEGECESHTLACKKAAPNLLEISVIYGPAAETTKQLLDGPFSETMVFAKGKMNTILPIRSVNSIPNGENGSWSLSVYLEFSTEVMGLLTSATVEGASITLGKNSFPIVPSKSDGDKFLAFLDKCAALWEGAE